MSLYYAQCSVCLSVCLSNDCSVYSSQRFTIRVLKCGQFCASLCFVLFLVNHEKSTVKCISAAACGEQTSGGRPGGDIQISADSCAIGQPDCQVQAEETSKDGQTSNNKTIQTVQTVETRQARRHVNCSISFICLSSCQKHYKIRCVKRFHIRNYFQALQISTVFLTETFCDQTFVILCTFL